MKKRYTLGNVYLEYFQGQLNRDVMIPDDKKQEMKAMLVFSASITYLKDHMMNTLNKRYVQQTT